jgi:hypothetical protein
MTFVFAKERTEEAIREALFERRTAVYYKEDVIGEEVYLKELFENAVEIKVTKNDKSVIISFVNKSDLIFHLSPQLTDVTLDPYTIQPQSTRTITVSLNNDVKGGAVNFIVENFLVEPNKGMKYTIKI